jgi:hypothetical protein
MFARPCWLAVAVLPVLVGGCAIAFEGADGRVAVFGFATLRQAPGPSETIAGDIVEISTVGVSVLMLDQTTSVALGYQSITRAALRDNALVLGPLDGRAVRFSKEGEAR